MGRAARPPFPADASATARREAELLTNTGGDAYRDLCEDNSVPIPPDFGPGSPWVSRGLMPEGSLFIVGDLDAEVLTYESAAPAGVCVALPRFDSVTDTVALNGVICLGTTSSKACFWDNSKNGVQFTFQSDAVKPLSAFGGGIELEESAGHLHRLPCRRKPVHH